MTDCVVEEKRGEKRSEERRSGGDQKEGRQEGTGRKEGRERERGRKAREMIVWLTRRGRQKSKIKRQKTRDPAWLMVKES